MDETSLAFEVENKVKTKKSRKRSSKGVKALTTDIIDLSTDAIDSIGDRIETKKIDRRAKPNDNHNEFDSMYFFGKAVKQISDKYKNNDNEDEIIDIENLEIIENSDLMENKDTLEIGFFAENTLTELQKKFRKRRSVKETVTTHFTPNSGSKSTKSKALEKTSVERQLKQLSPIAGPPVQAIEAALVEYETTVNESNSTENDIQCNALNKYENRNICMDTNHQISCLKGVIEMIKRDKSGSFRDGLRQKAVQAFGLPFMPSGPNLVVQIMFNLKTELNFSFYFRNPESPLDPTEQLNHFNKEMYELSKIIFDLIRVEPNKRII